MNYAIRSTFFTAALCPSDSKIITEETSTTWSSTQHNYPVCMGNTTFDSRDMTAGAVTVVGKKGLFVYEKPVAFRDCTDGLFNTIMVGEIITPEAFANWGALGRIVQVGGTGFTCFNNPNSSVNDTVLRCHTDLGGALGARCTATAGGEGDYAAQIVAPRSWHTGGVNVAFGDGSVRFISDHVNNATFRALGGRSDGLTTGEY